MNIVRSVKLLTTTPPFVESASKPGMVRRQWPAMETHSQRWPTDMWAAIEIAAKHKGESISEYIRTAALSRAAYDAARRGDAVTERFDQLWHEAAEAGKNLREVYDLGEE